MRLVLMMELLVAISLTHAPSTQQCGTTLSKFSLMVNRLLINIASCLSQQLHQM
jgi:hypothetical protein